VVLTDYVRNGALTLAQAIKTVEDLLFHTSNKLYNLGLQFMPFIPFDSGAIGGDKSLGWTFGTNSPMFTNFLKVNRDIKYVRLQWVDYTATCRARVIPIKQALKLFTEGGQVGITKASLSLLQDDSMAAGGTGTGEYSVQPCFESLRLGVRPGYATVQGEFREKTGEQVDLCPRTALKRTIDYAQRVGGVELLVGYEIEVVFMRKIATGDKWEHQYGASQVTEGHAWSTARAMHDNDMMTMCEEIVEEMERTGISLQMFHPESAPGQFEFILPPAAPMASVENLLAAREIISTVAANHSMRATLYPKPFPGTAGTAAHMHISMNDSKQYQAFYAGVLEHLGSIVAFSYSNMASYERMVDSCWAGGTWVTWGTQNRETPLRQIEGAHWELKVIDGLANPYFVLAAVITAGILGMLDSLSLPRDCTVDPASLDEGGRRQLGITQKLPKDLPEALQTLEYDEGLVSVLGKELVEQYCAVKMAEHERMEKMEPEERKMWLIERY